jgi:hypothetical protein
MSCGVDLHQRRVHTDPVLGGYLQQRRLVRLHKLRRGFLQRGRISVMYSLPGRLELRCRGQCGADSVRRGLFQRHDGLVLLHRLQRWVLQRRLGLIGVQNLRRGLL